MSDEILVPHLALPFRFERSGAAAVLEQDTVEEIAQCVQVLVLTHEGERLPVPDYGIADLVFNDSTDIVSITDAIEEWEPRAASRIIENPDSRDELLRQIFVRVSTKD